MKKNVLIFGGGTGLSFLLKGLKNFPIDITAVVSVCDNGLSTGRLREEFDIPAVGDIRKVLVSLSETEPLFEKLLNYKFNTTSDLNGHKVGNLLLTAMTNVTGSLSSGVESLSKVLNLKGKVIPITEDVVDLIGIMEDDNLVYGEHSITEDKRIIKDIKYNKDIKVNDDVLEAIRRADLIIFSMGSIYTSIIPNLLSEEVINELDKYKNKIMYTSNMMSQPGETDKMNVGDHIKIINKYLGSHKIDVVVANNKHINCDIALKYATTEQKDPVLIDYENIDIKIIEDDLVIIEDEIIRHDTMKLAFLIYSYLIRGV